MDQKIKSLLGKQVIETCQNTKGYFSLIFVVPKNRRGVKTNHQCEISKLLSSCTAFQNGKYILPSRHYETGGLNGKNRPLRCLFQCEDFSLPSQVPQVSIERSGLSILGPPIWFGQSSKGFFEDYARSSEPSERERDKASAIPG